MIRKLLPFLAASGLVLVGAVGASYASEKGSTGPTVQQAPSDADLNLATTAELPSAACIQAMLQARKAVAKAPGGEVQLADNCGTVVNKARFSQQAPIGVSATNQLCRDEGYRNTIGLWLWRVVTCEAWSFNGARVTWYENPPTHRYGGSPGFRVTRLGRGVDTGALPDSIGAWSSTQVEIGLPPHIPVASFEVSHTIRGYSDGSGETDEGPAN